MKLYICFIITFFISLSYQAQIIKGYKKTELVFDQSLGYIENVNIKSIKNYNSLQLLKQLNLNCLKKERVETNKIEFGENKVLPNYWNFAHLKNSLVGYYYGIQSVLGNNLYLYTEDFQNEDEKFNSNQYHQVGLLLIERNGNFISWVKVFETNIDSEKFLESFLYKNYIILIETLDWGYDVIDVNSKKQVKYKYIVLEIKSDGNVIKLEKKASEKIKKEWKI